MSVFSAYFSVQYIHIRLFPVTTGVAKELFTLAIKLLCKETGILQPTSDGRSVWFTKNSRMLWDFIRRGEQYVLDRPQQQQQQQQQQRSGCGTGGEKSFLDIMKSLSRFKIPRKDSVPSVIFVCLSVCSSCLYGV